MLPPLKNGLNTNIFYTPKIQKIMFSSDELVKYLAYLSRKKYVDAKDMRQMTKNILTEYQHSYTIANLS